MANIVQPDLETMLAAAPNTTTDSLYVTVGQLREMQSVILTMQAQIALLRSLVPGS